MAKLTVTLRSGEDYFAELDKKLKQYHITHAALAREMGMSPVQVSRMFNKKPQNPQVDTIWRIEQAVDTLRRRAAQSSK